MMTDRYGSDYITITDEDGQDYELEVLNTIEYNGCTYLAVMPADETMEPEVIILKSLEEDGEPILSIIEDEDELQTVNTLIMDALFSDSDEV